MRGGGGEKEPEKRVRVRRGGKDTGRERNVNRKKIWRIGKG